MPDDLLTDSAGAADVLVSIHISDGPEKGKEFPLDAGRNVIGRSPSSSVHLSENEVSREHACITVGREIRIEDLGSAVGTSLNGRLMVAPDFLFDNDEIVIGPYTLRVEVKQKESRQGILIALCLLAVSLLICLIAWTFPAERYAAENAQAASASASKSANEEWRNWETLILPDKEALEEQRVPITVRSAMDQYNFATRLYQDRLGDLSNAYQAQLYYKRALAILSLISAYEKRPCIANRSLDRIVDLRKMIRRQCDRRVFSYQRAYRLRWKKEGYRVLREIRQISPWSRCRYNRWTRREWSALRRLRKG